MAFSSASRSVKLYFAGDSTGLERTLSRTETRLKRFERVAGRGSTLNSGLIGGFSKGGAITAGIGVAVLGLKNVTDAAKDAQVVLGQTSVAVEGAGLSWSQYASQVEAASDRISKSSAFDDEDVLKSFQVFVRGQKDVGKSLELAGLAADVARGRYTTLESATMLVNKAAMGQIGALRRAGIQIDKNATSTQALAALQAAYGGAAVRYANSAAGAQDKLRVSIENAKETLGSGLLPVVTEFALQASAAADATNRLAQALQGLNFDLPGGGSLGGALKGSLFLGPNALKAASGRGKGSGSPDVAGGAAASDSQFGFGALEGGKGERKGRPKFGEPGFKPGKTGIPVTKLSTRLESQDLDARLGGNRNTLKGVLSKEAAFLQDALKDVRLKPGEVVALKQSLLGVTQEIQGIDDAIIADATDKKQAAKDAADKIRQSAKDAKEKAKRAREAAQAALKKQADAFKDQADAIKSAVLDTFDTKSQKINNSRALEDARKALALQNQIGGPEGIKQANRDVVDAERAVQRQKLEQQTFSVAGGPKGPVAALSIGNNIVIHINGADDPKAIAKQVIAVISRQGKKSSGQSRGRMFPHTT